MIHFTEAILTQLSIHKAGNKQNGEGLVLSESPVTIEDDFLKELLLQFYLNPFTKTRQVYRFHHPSAKLGLNEVFHFSSGIFESPETFHEQTMQIARQLYAITSHPQIKSGELYFVRFDQLQIEGEQHRALGIFKSESKEPYLTINQQASRFQINYEKEAINIKKLDKGCLIFDTEKEAGYKVLVTDQTNQSEALYWTDDFLGLRVRNDSYTKTNDTLAVYKKFVTEKLDEAFGLGHTDKIDLLNRSIRYFKENDAFHLDDFANYAIGAPEGVQAFKEFKSAYEKEFDTQLDDHFPISADAVKKQSRYFRKVLKLDKNFHIYIHGNTEYIEKGFDEERKLNYYKVYFKNEN